MKISLSSIFLSNFSNLAGTQFCGEIKTSVSRQSHADGNGSDHCHRGALIHAVIAIMTGHSAKTKLLLLLFADE